MRPSPSDPDYVKVKRAKTGACNICLSSGELTWDHVPPQGGMDISPLDQYTILERLAGRSESPNRLSTQNGVKYRTICKKCNGDLLGREYDPVLNDFAVGIGQFLKTSIWLPPRLCYPTRPARLLRSLFGHLLAAKSEVENTKEDEAMRHYVQDHQATLPSNLNVFFWVYPYSQVVVIRDVAMLAERGNFRGSLGVFSILKYFPIAYIVTNLQQYEGLPSLSFHCPTDIDTDVRIRIPLRHLKPPDWPEIVDDGNIMAGGGCSAQSSVSAVPKGIKLRGQR